MYGFLFTIARVPAVRLFGKREFCQDTHVGDSCSQIDPCAGRKGPSLVRALFTSGPSSMAVNK